MQCIDVGLHTVPHHRSSFDEESDLDFNQSTHSRATDLLFVFKPTLAFRADCVKHTHTHTEIL